MTNLYVIRNIKQRDAYIERLRNKEMPYKILEQDMLILRTIEMNSYYFGVVLRMIADEIGELSVDDLHEIIAYKFRIKYYWNDKIKQMVFERTSTTQDDIQSFWDYVDKICVWALEFLNLQIPQPWEVIVQDKVNEIRL